MKLVTLMENTAAREGFLHEHGLSLYIETNRHKILFDAGKTGNFATNAEKLGVDLEQVDIAILSHGHDDHGGGLPEFLRRNKKAPIYVNKHAFEPHFNTLGRNIGLNRELESSGRLILTGDETVIDQELTLRTCNAHPRKYPMPTCGLTTQEEGKTVPEDFRHEQYLQILQGNQRILITGCSHKGVLNLVEWFTPEVLVGGFHFMTLQTQGEDAAFLEEAARRLCSYPTRYYTGHCTGREQYAFLKERMGTRLEAIRSGTVLELL